MTTDLAPAFDLLAFVASIAVPHKIEENVTRGPRGFSILIAPE